MFDDETGHIVLLCYIHWLQDIDDNEKYYLESKWADVEWHGERSKEISELLYLCWPERVADDDSLIEDLRDELDACSKCIDDCKESYWECEEEYNQFVSVMHEESWRLSEICAYNYSTDTLTLVPRNVNT